MTWPGAGWLSAAAMRRDGLLALRASRRGHQRRNIGSVNGRRLVASVKALLVEHADFVPV